MLRKENPGDIEFGTWVKWTEEASKVNPVFLPASIGPVRTGVSEESWGRMR